MHRIECPWCGPRDENEFSYQGDAACRRPTLGEPSERIEDLLYFRDNPKGIHTEYWHHVSGCQQYIVVERHTLTHEIRSVRLARVLNDEEPV